MTHSRLLPVVISATITTAVVLAPGFGPGGARATAEDTSAVELVLQDLDFIVEDALRLEFVVVGDAPDVAPPTTSTTTVPDTTVVPDDQAEAGSDSATTPTSPSTASTTSTTTSTTAPAENDAGNSNSDGSNELNPSILTTVKVSVHPAIETRVGAAVLRTGPVIPSALGEAMDTVEVDVSRYAEVDPDTGERRLRVTTPMRVTGDKGPTRAAILETPGPGLYPVTVSLLRDGELLAAHLTMIEYSPSIGATDWLGPIGLSVLAAIPEPDPATITSALVSTRNQIDLLGLLAERADVPLTVAIPPSLAVRVAEGDPGLGTTAPLLPGLLAGDELVALPRLRVDPAAAAAANLDEFFARQQSLGAEQLAQAFPESTIQRTVWFAHPSVASSHVTSEAATLLRDLGTQIVVVDYEDYTSWEGNVAGLTDPTLLTRIPHTDGTDGRVAVIDPVNIELEPSSATLGVSAVDRAVRVLAEIYAIRHQQGPADRSMVLSGIGFGVPDAEVVAVIERLASADRAVEFRPLSAAALITDIQRFGDEEVWVRWSGAPETDLRPRVDAVDTARARIADIAPMLPADDPRVAQWASRLEGSYSSFVSPAEAAATTARVAAELDAIVAAIVLPETPIFNLTGADTPLPVSIENRGDTPLEVIVQLVSSRLEAPAGQRVVLPVGSTTLRIEVSAIGTGTFPILVEILSPTGTRLGPEITLTARSNSVTGLGRTVAVGLVLVLLSWWLSHLRRARTKRVAQRLDASVGAHPSNAGQIELPFDADSADDTARHDGDPGAG